MQVGDSFKVLKGNKRIGLMAHNHGRVVEITEVPGTGVRVVLASAYGHVRVVVWTQSLKTLERPSFNLGCGDGINKISISWKSK